MGSLTHSIRPNGRDTPHHIRCLSCRSGFFDDLLPTAVPGLNTNAGGTLCSIVPSVSGHPRRRGTGPGPPGARTVSQGGADSDSSMLLTHPCSATAGAFFVADAPSRLHPSRGTLQYRSRALPKAARAPAWHADGPCPMFLGPVLVLSRRQSHHHTQQSMPFVASHDSPRDSAYKYHITLWRAPQCPIAPGILRSTFGHNLSVSGSRVPVAALFLTNPSRPTKLVSLYLDLRPESSQFSLAQPTILDKIKNLYDHIHFGGVVGRLPDETQRMKLLNPCHAWRGLVLLRGQAPGWTTTNQNPPALPMGQLLACPVVGSVAGPARGLVTTSMRISSRTPLLGVRPIPIHTQLPESDNSCRRLS